MLSLQTNYIGNLPILKKAWKKAAQNLTQPLEYPSTVGYEPLRGKIAEYYDVAMERVLITNSATEAIHLISQIESIHIPRPAFFGALRQKNVRVSVASAAYLNSIQHSITGKTLSANAIKTAKDFVEAQVFDNPYSLLAEKKLRKLHTGTYTIGSFSKLFGPGLRIGYIITEPAYISKLKSLHISASLSCPLTTQELAYRMLHALPELQEVRKEQLEEGTKWLRELDFNVPNPCVGLHTSICISKQQIPSELAPFVQNMDYTEEDNNPKMYLPINISASDRKALKRSLEKLTVLLQ